MDIKSTRMSGLKAGADDGLKDGEFLAYASTWTREPDSYGDVVVKGAFAETIVQWKGGDQQLPILFGHRMDDPDYWLGGAVDLREDDHGLLVKGEFDLENPKARQVYRMLKGKRINQMSFAFDTTDYAIVEEDGVQKRELRGLKLYEVSIVPIGANQDTEVLAVKAIADGIKAGKVLSAKNLSQLKSARDAIDEVILAAGETEDTSKASQQVADAGAQERAAKAAHARSAQAVAIAQSVLAY